MKISLIIPVFNEIDFLKRCFDSVQNQGIKFDEVIVIDDGSTDGSDKFIESYKNEFKIHLGIHHGVSYARNLGIKMATGDYITFLDSDDELLTNACEQMHNTINLYPNDEILQFNHLRYYAKKNKISHKMDNTNTYYSFEHITECNSWYGVWNKLIKRKVIVNPFKNGLQYGEDGLFIIELLTQGLKIHTIDLPTTIHHFENKNSLSHIKKKKDIQEQFHVYVDVLNKEIDKSWQNTIGMVNILKELCTNKVMKELECEKLK